MKKPLVIIPASAEVKPWDKLEPLFDDRQWYAEPKLDGWRFLLHFGGGLKRIYLTGRNITKDGTLSERGLHVPLFTPMSAALAKRGYTVLDGEVMPPSGAGFRDLNGIMGKTPTKKALARIREIGHPECHVFDCLYHDGDDVRAKPQQWRKDLADLLVSTLWLSSAPVYSVKRHIHKQEFFESQVRRGAEGIILKDSRAAYGEGWVKVKRFHTIDTVVTGFTDAKEGKTGKFKGLIGAVIVSVYRGKQLVEVGQVSGMNDATRVWFTKHRERILKHDATVIEIKAQELSKDRLRHPRFSRFRPDMALSKCTYEKMLRDLQANKNAKKED